MERLILPRGPSTDQGTFGKLILPPSIVDKSFYTVELPWRDNKPKISCIPPGLYVCRWHISPKFGPSYIITNVPGRSDCLLHNGNWAGDEALEWFTNSDGCILVGHGRAVLETPTKKMQEAITGSKDARAEFERIMAERDFELDVQAFLGAA